MRKISQILFMTMLISILCYSYSTTGFIPEDQLVFDQIAFEREAVIGDNITVGIFIKNFLNYTITNITVSLNLTDSNQLRLSSCSFGVLTGDNITINETLASPAIGDFTTTNITGLYMSNSYLEYNISEIKPNQSVIFNYNITSDTIVSVQIPYAYMSYYDNWTDLQENIGNRNRFLLDFVSGIPTLNPFLPQWTIGNKIPEGWVWVIFVVVPVVIAATASFILSFKRR